MTVEIFLTLITAILFIFIWHFELQITAFAPLEAASKIYLSPLNFEPLIAKNK